MSFPDLMRCFFGRSLRFWQGLAVRLWQGRSLLLLPLLAIGLSGCVDADISVRFDNPSSGEIIQQIRVGERLRSLSDPNAKQWLATIDRQSRRVGGHIERRRDQSLVVRIPFSDATDLETKFNQFYNPSAQAGTDLPPIASHLTVRRNNFLVLERNWLRYDLDLRSLGVTAADGSVVITPASLLNLKFRLASPWSARSLTKSETRSPGEKVGKQLVWQLAPGEVSRIEAVFWMPNWLGIGTIGIVLLVGAGMYLKSAQALPLPAAENTQVLPQ